MSTMLALCCCKIVVAGPALPPSIPAYGVVHGWQLWLHGGCISCVAVVLLVGTPLTR